MSRAENKLQAVLDVGVERTRQVIQKIQEEQPKDLIVPSGVLTFEERENRLLMRILGDNPQEFGLHKHALGQVADKSGIPRTYVDRLMAMGAWGAALLALNFNELFAHTSLKKYMARTVKDEVRGFLSDRYLRVDAGLLVESFIKACSDANARPIQATYLDTKFQIQMAIPKIFSIGDDPVIWGMALKESSFGDGAHTLSVFIKRLVCMNGMLGDDVLRRVHLGARASDDLVVSEKTFQLDSQALASLIGDAVQQFLVEEVIKERLEALQESAETKINLKDILKGLRDGSRISKKEETAIAELFNLGGVEELPPGNTVWRLANAISLFSQGEDVEPARKMDLEYLAGTVLGLDKKSK